VKNKFTDLVQEGGLCVDYCSLAGTQSVMCTPRHTMRFAIPKLVNIDKVVVYSLNENF